MKLLHIQCIAIVALALQPGYVSASEKPKSVVIIPQFALDPSGVREVYETRKGQCTISLELSDMGGFKILTLPSKAKKNMKIDDVTGVAYRANDTLVFTVSPIYGDHAGVYTYDCVTRQKKQIVRPRSIDEADYFELKDVREDIVFFYYTPDMNATDFTRFRSMDFLYEVQIDGSGFRKVWE